MICFIGFEVVMVKIVSKALLNFYFILYDGHDIVILLNAHKDIRYCVEFFLV